MSSEEKITKSTTIPKGLVPDKYTKDGPEEAFFKQCLHAINDNTDSLSNQRNELTSLRSNIASIEKRLENNQGLTELKEQFKKLNGDPEALVELLDDRSPDTWLSSNIERFKSLLNAPHAVSAIIGKPSVLTALAGNSGAMEQVVACVTAMHAIADSQIALQIMVNSNTAMAKMVGNPVAMDVLCENPITLTVLLKNPSAIQLINDSSMAITKLIAGLAGLKPQEWESMTALAGNSEAVLKIAANDRAMLALTISDKAMLAVASSAKALNAIIQRSCACQKIEARLQKHRRTLHQTLQNASSDTFTRAKKQLNSEGATRISENDATFCIPTSCSDSTDTDYNIHSLLSGNRLLASTKVSAKKEENIDMGIALRGVEIKRGVLINGPSGKGQVKFDTFTAAKALSTIKPDAKNELAKRIAELTGLDSSTYSDLNKIISSESAMVKISNNTDAMKEVVASADALYRIIKSATASCIIESKLQSHRDDVKKTLESAPSSLFIKQFDKVTYKDNIKVIVKDENAFYIPIVSYRVRNGSTKINCVYSIFTLEDELGCVRHEVEGKEIPFSQGIGLRGVRVELNAHGYVSFDVYRAVQGKTL
ncbi:hypothetical protein [Candidatus Regiella insecticola]|uniref:Tail fiber protein n=1 Tax=Candidatus Regiella insecticola TaxID=138073 RepID=A0A6L2ZRC8_9ENTR|nr:hypothetical protein [Candidatus Regiella insecticola]GFN47417.1 tail fiber protein [Candidatus Regiella insecticola]